MRVRHLYPERFTGKESIHDGLFQGKEKITVQQALFDDTHNGVDAPQGNSEHGLEICAGGKSRCHDCTHAKNHSKETRLNGATNESVENIVRPAETSFFTREKDDQND